MGFQGETMRRALVILLILSTVVSTVAQPAKTASNANQAPVARFTATIASSSPSGMVVSFDARASSDPDGQAVMEYEWDFGDGGWPAAGDAAPTHTYAQPGSYLVTLRVSDGSEWSEPYSATVSAPQNRRPEAHFTVLTSPAVAGKPVSFANGSTDPDNDTLTYEWRFGDGQTSTALHPTVTFSSQGTKEVVLVASDGRANGQDDHVVYLQVGRGNEAPLASFTFSPQAPEAGQPIEFNSTSVDGDGDPLSYSWDFGDGSGAGVKTPSKTYASAGSRTVRLTVTDSMGATNTSAPQTVTVRAANQPPIVEIDASVESSAPGAMVVRFNNRSRDPEGQPLFYEWNFGDGFLGIQSTEASPRYTYAEAKNYTATLRVSDGRLSAEDTAAVIAPVNRPPIVKFSWTPAQPKQGETVTFLNETIDPDQGDSLRYTWSFGDGTPNSDAVSPTHVYNVIGLREVTLIASDGKANGTDSQTELLQVNRGNEAPVDVDFTVDPAAPVARQQVTFRGTARDGDNDALTYSWDFGDGTGGTGKDATKTYATAGTRTVTLTVRDSMGASAAPVRKTVVVAEPNRPPTPDFTWQVLNATQTSLPVYFDAGPTTDLDNDTLTYTWDFGDASNRTPGTGVKPQHTYTQPNTYTVTLTVTDHRSPAVTKTHSVEVRTNAPTVNRRPAAGFSWSPAQPVAGQLVTFTNTSTDLDNDPLTYVWNFRDGTSTVTAKDPLKSFATAGEYRITLEVSDGKADGASAIDHTITIAPKPDVVNDPPVADFRFSPTAPVAGQAVTFTDLSTDRNNDPLTYSWSFGDNTTSTARNPIKTYNTAGSRVVSLSVSDGRGGAHTVTKPINVSPTDTAAPRLTFNYATGTVVTTPALAVSIEVTGTDLQVSTGSVRLNGADVTASFTTPVITPTRIVANSTLQLSAGLNTLVAAVSDAAGRRGETSIAVTYQLSDGRPILTFNRPSGATVTDPAFPIVITATGSELVVSTGAIHLNGTPVTSLFAIPEQTPARVVASGTLQLAPGLNTIVAGITEANGKRGEASFTVTYNDAASGLANPTVTAPANLPVTPGAQGTVKFQVRNNSTTQRTFAFVATSSNPAVVTDPADPISQVIPAGATLDVPVSVSVLSGAAAGATATIALTATDSASTARTGSASFVATVALVNFQLDLSPHNGENLDTAQFGATLSYTTPPYVSMDTPRAVTLFYSSAQASPKGFVQVDVTDNSTTPAEQYSILLRDKDGKLVTLTTGTTEAFYAGGAGISRLAAQFDAAALPTGAYTYTLVVRKWTNGIPSERTAPIRVLILNEIASLYGAGWTVAGLMRIHKQSDGLVLTSGDGTIQFFPAGPCTGTTCSYNAPRGVFLKSLVAEGSERFVLTDHDGGTAVFGGTDGLHWRNEDRYLNRTSYGYVDNRLTTITDPAGKIITLDRVAGGFTISDAGTPSRVVTVRIDGNNDLQSIVDPENVTALQAEYGNHRVANWTDRGGNRWDVAYDTFGSPRTTTAPTVTVREPSGADVQVRPTSTLMSLPSAVLPEAGRGATAANPAARVIPADVRVRLTDAKNNTTAVQVDRFGAPRRIEAPLGHTTIIDRDEHSRVLRTTAPSGMVVENEWDPILPLLKKVTTKISDTKQQIVEYTYEPRYLQSERTWGDGIEEVLNRYDDGRLRETRLAGDEARVTHYHFDGRGRIKEVSDPEGHGTFYAYDATNVWMNADSIGTGMAGAPAARLRATTFTYDHYGQTETVTDPDGHTSSNVYDLLGRARYVIDGNNGTTEYVYDRMFLRNVIDPEKKSHTFDYNAMGWLVRQLDPEQRATTYRHDRNGNVVSHTNRNLQTVTFTHDALGRVLTRTADGATTTYTYDNPAGREMSVENALSKETLHYNAAGDLTGQVSVRNGVTYTLSSVYDPRHRREQVSLTTPFTPVRSVRYGYVAEQLETLKALDDLTTTFHYNDDGQLESVTLPTNRPLTRHTLYASNHRATRAIYDDGNVDLSLGYWLALTKRGLIESVYNTTWQKVRNYGYDGTGQLRTVEDADVTRMEPCPDDSASFTSDGEPCGMPQLSQPTWSQTFSYDKAGNRTDSGAVLEGNRLKAFAGQTLGYDNEGNLTSRTTAAGVQTFAWNSLGQLTSVTIPGTGTYSYGYDALGRRMRRTDPSGTVTEYLYDEDDLFMELRNGAPLREYTYYPNIDRPHSVVQREGSRKDETFYYAMEEPNNVAALIDKNNQLTNRYVYQPYGVTQSVTEGTPNPLRFMAREWDPGTGLYYVRNRWYAPDLARFISEDPIGLEGGINPYAYADNNPINNVDPFGLAPCPADILKLFPGLEMTKCRMYELEPLVVIAPRGNVWNFSTPKNQAWTSRFLSSARGIAGDAARSIGLQAPTRANFDRQLDTGRCMAQAAWDGLTTTLSGWDEAAKILIPVFVALKLHHINKLTTIVQPTHLRAWSLVGKSSTAAARGTMSGAGTKVLAKVARVHPYVAAGAAAAAGAALNMRCYESTYWDQLP
jgi:RHS repeat-associated protein